MISNRNKLIAFVLAGILTLISWGIIFLNIILRITTLMQIGLYSIDTIGFFIVTVLLSIFTLSILFKVRATSYTPVIFILLHMMTLNGGGISYFFLIFDLLIMIFLNMGATTISTSSGGYSSYQSTNQRYYDQGQNNRYNNQYNETNAQRSNQFNDDDVFDAEYSTKE